ncbi:hypothetical protein [Azospirillum melinis]
MGRQCRKGEQGACPRTTVGGHPELSGAFACDRKVVAGHCAEWANDIAHGRWEVAPAESIVHTLNPAHDVECVGVSQIIIGMKCQFIFFAEMNKLDPMFGNFQNIICFLLLFSLILSPSILLCAKGG